MAPDAEDAYVGHVVAQINASLEFLVERHQLSRPDATLIKSKLPASVPTAAVGNMSLQPTGTSVQSAVTANSIPPTPTGGSLQPNVDRSSERASSPSPNGRPPLPSRQPSAQPVKRARAQWAYAGGAVDDLRFEKGEIIVIESIENADWWRGHVEGREGVSGLLPANHCVLIEGERSNSNPPPPQPPFQSPVPPYPQQWPQQQWSPQQPYPPPQYEKPAGQPEPQQPPQIIVEGKKKKNPMGGRLGQAFVGGVGFGTGSAIAGNIVNAII